MQNERTPSSNVEGISLTLTRALGMYGAAYDPPGVPLRAYTHEHQPGNQAAWRLGRAVSALQRHPSAGDHIDTGLYLLKEMQAQGFGVFEVEAKAAAPAPEPNVLSEAVKACDRFFREAMPQMNVKDSALDANAIDAWNKAEIAVSRAMATAAEGKP